MRSTFVKPLIAMMMCAALFVAGCGSSSTTTDDTTTRIYVVGADGGLASLQSPGIYRFTLTGVDAGVDWYTDRPGRATGEETTADYVTGSWSSVYGEIEPNAFVQYHDGAALHALTGQISSPTYDTEGKTLSFNLVVSKASTDLTGGIGDFTAPVVTVMNNLTPPAEGSAFALYGDTAKIEDDGASGYRLIMTGVDASVFWINNAPARAAEFESATTFGQSWSLRFGDTPPNASLAGDQGDGTPDLLDKYIQYK